MFARFENLILYTLCTVIWGSTWFVITLQIDAVSPATAVFWRFLLASFILLAYCLFKNQNLRYPFSLHIFFAIQGILMFSINYMLNYVAETLIPSGLVALAFTMLIYFNMFGMRLFFKKPITPSVMFGSIFGGCGIIVIFSNEILSFDLGSQTLLGLGIGILATLAASLGMMMAQKSYRLQIPVLVTNTYGMFYGSIFTLLIALINSDPLGIPLTMRFLGALLYLALFGSVIAFGAYLSLSGKIGAEKAAYTTVISPIIALLISSYFEGFQVTPSLLAGVALCLLGNILTLSGGWGAKQTKA